jgi:hypothetical protein
MVSSWWVDLPCVSMPRYHQCGGRRHAPWPRFGSFCSCHLMFIFVALVRIFVDDRPIVGICTWLGRCATL